MCFLSNEVTAVNDAPQFWRSRHHSRSQTSKIKKHMRQTIGGLHARPRIAGALYLLTIVTGVLAQYLGGGLVAAGDAASTASSISAHITQFRFAFLADLVMTASYVAVTACFYELFKSASRSLSLVAACLSLVGCAVLASSLLFYLATLFVLGDTAYLSAFTSDQVQAIAMLSIKFKAYAYIVALTFFGFYCLLIGLLIFKSRIIPKFIGVLMTIAGLAWLTYAWPPLAASLSPYTGLPGLIGEGTLALWLLIRGAATSNSSRDFAPIPHG